ncbi:MAG: peptide chain release factor 1 [Candidatus Komeilibacteria bacterium CG_4_9_14_0_8_um_filter_36_9]|uniref:Peptide chain release factor 1 n=1 Tax=Candidatus Komeilibacteria bacterium CG_4_9_14_0_8_um_filter_36_9 TaxID=1974473 RepID=A0A2M8DS26_9BACT|nr:MAG: peptide chain release factor 1 [Candidatus Komeilibacteria bacterium CG_4_9_14_0_8_um_filter_36_9]
MKDSLNKYQEKYQKLEAELQNSDNFSDAEKMKNLAQEFNEVKEIVDKLQQYQSKTNELAELNKNLASETDEEMLALIREEIIEVEQALTKLETEAQELMRPQNPNDKKNAIVEIRAGSGGDESSLFAADLYRMYSRYAEKNSWKISLINSNRTEVGGFKEIIFEVKGLNVYGKLKYEAGVHRVQRVPDTEKSGRVHTSAASVVVLPEAEEIDLKIEPSDIRIDTFCASGHGGQSVNTTYSAVRITHLPTNLVATCQDEKSQTQNKIKAMQVLRSRVLQQMEDAKNQAESVARKSLIGSGDRSEKIRTYNWPQDRITDHRINLTLHNMNSILNGDLDQIIDELKKAANANN